MHMKRAEPRTLERHRPGRLSRLPCRPTKHSGSHSRGRDDICDDARWGWMDGVLEAGAGVAHLAGRRPQHVTEHQKQLEDGKYFYSTSRIFQIAERHLPSLPCHPMIHLAPVAPLDSRLRGNA